jgi:hypothetical protein
VIASVFDTEGNSWSSVMWELAQERSGTLTDANTNVNTFAVPAVRFTAPKILT